MIHEKYRSLLPFRCLTPFQNQCMKEIFVSGKNSIITSPLAIGELFIPEFSIIKLLQTEQKHLIFYVFYGKNQSCNTDYFVSRYILKSINIQKVSKFSDIESSEDWTTQTTIFIVSFSGLLNIFKSAPDDFLLNISLVVFENITSFILNSFSFEIFIFYTHQYKYRVVGINYSYEARDKLCKAFNMLDESKEILTYKGPKNNILNLIPIQDNKDSSFDNLFLIEIRKYLPDQKIVIFCNSKTNVQNNAKLIEASCPSLIQNESVNKYLYDINDSNLRLHLSKGVGVIDGFSIEQNKKIWQIFNNGIIKVLVVHYSSFLLMTQDNENETTDSVNYKLDVVFFRTNVPSPTSISFLTPDFCNNAIVFCDSKNIELINNYIQGNPIIKPEKSFNLPRFILRIFRIGHFKTEVDIENAYKNCYDNSSPLSEALECLFLNKFIQNISELPEKESKINLIEITNTGKIAEEFDVDFKDIDLFLYCQPPKSYEELLAFLCTKTSTASRSIEIKDGDNQKLKLMLEDPKIQYEKSFIYNCLPDEEQNQNSNYINLSEIRSFTPGEKAYILLLYSNYYKENFTDSDFVSDNTRVCKDVSILCSCYQAVSDMKRSFLGMCYSRELKKRLKHGGLSSFIPLYLLKQLPGVGPVYSAKLYAEGIKTYKDILELTPQKIKDIIKKTNNKLNETIKLLPDYVCHYELKPNNDESDLEIIGNLIVTVSNNRGPLNTGKNGDEIRIFLICGMVDSNIVLYFDELQKLEKPIVVDIPIDYEINLEALEFRVINSEFIGPDIIMKIKSEDLKGNSIWKFNFG